MKKEELILKYLKEKALSFSELRNKLSDEIKINNRDLDAILFNLKKENKIYFSKRTQKYAIKDEESLTGVFKETRFGYGFVESEDRVIFIPEKFTNTALNNDTVKVILFSIRDEKEPEKRSGKIVRIVKRNGNNIIIRVKKENDKIVYLPDDESKYTYEIMSKILYPIDSILVTKFKAVENKIVYVDVKKILGTESDAKIDYLVLAYKNNIHLKFPQEVIDEVKNIKNNSKEERVDYKNLLTYTIDGISSKDLDDAISLEKNDKGFTLYVHIADVSHYVTEKSVLDYEAFKRCNSIYLIDKVFPMLPEVLSNELCSLNPNVDRLSLTCKMVFDNKGKLKSYQIHNSIINSNFRLTYEEVDVFLKEPNKQKLRDDAELTKSILLAKELSDLIRNEKLENGMIDFSLPETKIDLDENGEPLNIWNKFQTKSEKIIEDLMVITNQTVAEFLIKNNVNGIFRIHEKPKETNITRFFDLLKIFVPIPADSYAHINQQWFTRFLTTIKDTDYELILKRNMVQTMEKAMYSPKNLGHYALGIEEYLHFTSPIRRYADLIVHRNIKKFLSDQKHFENNNFNNLEEISLECSKKERDAAMIERKLKDIKKIRFLSKNKADSYNAIIVSFSRMGIYVEIDNLIQGIVKYTSFLESEYSYDENNFSASIVINGNEKKFKLGDKVNIKIENLSLVRGQIDFVII